MELSGCCREAYNEQPYLIRTREFGRDLKANLPYAQTIYRISMVLGNFESKYSTETT